MLCSFAMALDGISIGSEDYKHLPVVNLLGLVATAAFLKWCHVNAFGLQHIWYGLVVVFAVRLAVHLAHHLGFNAQRSLVAEALGWRALRRQPVSPMCLAAPV